MWPNYKTFDLYLFFIQGFAWRIRKFLALSVCGWYVVCSGCDTGSVNVKLLYGYLSLVETDLLALYIYSNLCS